MVTSFEHTGSLDSVYVAYQGPPLFLLESRKEWAEYASAMQLHDPSIRPTGWAAWAYDALGIAYDAVVKTLETAEVPSRRGVYRVLRGLNAQPPGDEYNYSGALYDYSFDHFNDNVNGRYYMYEYKDSSFQYLDLEMDN